MYFISAVIRKVKGDSQEKPYPYGLLIRPYGVLTCSYGSFNPSYGVLPPSYGPLTRPYGLLTHPYEVLPHPCGLPTCSYAKGISVKGKGVRPEIFAQKNLATKTQRH